MRTTHIIKALAVSGMLAGALTGGLAHQTPMSPAIPMRQQACTNSALTLTGGSAAYHRMGVSVHINDGATPQRIVAFASLDANVTIGAEMRLSWSIDGRPATDYAFGPGNIAENQEFWGARTVMDVIRLGPGTHTLTPEVRLSGGPSASGNVGHICTIAEAFAK